MGGTEFDVGPTADRRRGRHPAGRRGSRWRDDAQARRAAGCAIADPLLASAQQGGAGHRDCRRDPRPGVRRHVTARAGSTLAGLAERPRRALLAHPDGARVISASQLSLTMAAISELAMSTLVARGIPLRQARVIVLTVERFTVGHVLEKQAPRPDAAALKNFDMATFAEPHPTAVAAIAEYFRPGRTVDDLFRDYLEVVIAGAAIKAAATS